jgi:dihydrofolate reductase
MSRILTGWGHTCPEIKVPIVESTNPSTYMSKLRVHCFTISLDGFGAGPGQDLANPLGIGGEGLHPWLLGTRTSNQMFGTEGGATGLDDDFAQRGNENIGAWILGRNMFGPVRGPWLDDTWKGWWGDNPVYHVPVFVLTHHAREPLVMAGGTTFHFVTGGIEEAYKLAIAAAGGRDVRVGGGAATIRQYLLAGLVDEMHVAVAPVILGSGERLFEGVDLRQAGFEVASCVSSPAVTHFVLKRQRKTA